MSKPFFFRITAAELLSAVVQVPEDKRGEWILKFAIDLVSADPENVSTEFAKIIINEAHEFRAKKRKAAEMRWNAEQSKGDAVHSTAMPEAVTVTEAVPIQKQKKTNRRFTPPDITEVEKFCQERGRGVDPQRWYDFYSSKGWMIGKNKMKDWKAAVRTWEKNEAPNQGRKYDDIL